MLQIQCLQSKTLEVNALFSRFAIGPLKKGQGLTIGNALRRVLLSDLQGLAIAGVRISQVNHEFSTLPEVKEDVIDILLNLKQIVLKGFIKESFISRLSYHGPGIITAKNIELPEEVKLVEPNQYIATVNTSKIIEMELLIKIGEGYSITNGNNIGDLPEGFLGIDTVFMPVKKVNFFIETASNEASLDLESLILEVNTNGSITPIQAISSAAEILQNILSSLKITDSPLPIKAIKETNLTKETNTFDSILIEELELSVRAFNCLKRANIHTLADLLKYSQEELLEFKNFGQKSADEVVLNLQKKFGKTLNS